MQLVKSSFPDQWSHLSLGQWKYRVLTTGPPENSLSRNFKWGVTLVCSFQSDARASIISFFKLKKNLLKDIYNTVLVSAIHQCGSAVGSIISWCTLNCSDFLVGQVTPMSTSHLSWFGHCSAGRFFVWIYASKGTCWSFDQVDCVDQVVACLVQESKMASLTCLAPWQG